MRYTGRGSGLFLTKKFSEDKKVGVHSEKLLLSIGKFLNFVNILELLSRKSFY